MGSPAAANVIRVLAINVVIDGLVSTPAALMQRYFRQGKKMVADQANNWVGTGTSIALALAHFGAMSLAIGRLAGAAVAAVIFIVFSPEPLRFGFDRKIAGSLFRFGMPLAGASIIVFAVQNVDQIVVGRLLGATALGYYALAFNISSWPLNIFSMPVRSVAPALFSRLQHDRPAMRRGFLVGVGLLESVTLPVCLVISGAAVPIVHFVYGTRWEPAAAALVWLGGLAAVRIMFEFVYDFFVVIARSRVVFTVQLIWLVVLVPALIAGTKVYGIAGTGMAEVAVALGVVLPWYLTELNRVSIRRLAVATRLWLPLLAAGAVCAAAGALSHVIHNAFSACAAAGLVALGVVAVLGYHMRHEVSGLRATLREPQPAEVTESPRDIGVDAPVEWDNEPGFAVSGKPATPPPWEAGAMPAAGMAALDPDEHARPRPETGPPRPYGRRPRPAMRWPLPEPGEFRPSGRQISPGSPQPRPTAPNPMLPGNGRGIGGGPGQPGPVDPGLPRTAMPGPVTPGVPGRPVSGQGPHQPQGPGRPMPGREPVPPGVPGRPVSGQGPHQPQGPGRSVPGRGPVPPGMPGRSVPGRGPVPPGVPGRPVPGQGPHQPQDPGRPTPGRGPVPPGMPGRSVPGRGPVPPGVPGRPVPGQAPYPPPGAPGRPMPRQRQPRHGRQWIAEGRRIAASVVPETIPMPLIRDITGPLQVYRDSSGWTPIFQQTMRSTRVDPTDQGRGRHAR
jgi:PST family polysaccharide transporter